MRSEKVPCGTSSQIDCARQHHFFEQFVFADVGSDVTADLSGGEQQAHAQAVDANVVADGGEVLDPFANQCANQILRDAAQAESADHDGGAVEDVVNGLVRIGDDSVHRERILNQIVDRRFLIVAGRGFGQELVFASPSGAHSEPGQRSAPASIRRRSRSRGIIDQRCPSGRFCFNLFFNLFFNLSLSSSYFFCHLLDRIYRRTLPQLVRPLELHRQFAACRDFRGREPAAVQASALPERCSSRW